MLTLSGARVNQEGSAFSEAAAAASGAGAGSEETCGGPGGGGGVASAPGVGSGAGAAGGDSVVPGAASWSEGCAWAEPALPSNRRAARAASGFLALGIDLSIIEGMSVRRAWRSAQANLRSLQVFFRSIWEAPGVKLAGPGAERVGGHPNQVHRDALGDGLAEEQLGHDGV